MVENLEPILILLSENKRISRWQVLTPKMSSSRDVYSEDDNFLVGEDYMTERLRREARQLHLSKYRTTRQEAHFTRYRNSFLKCDLDRINERIEQEIRMKKAERERARTALLAQAKSRRKIDMNLSSDSVMKSGGGTVSLVAGSREELAGKLDLPILVMDASRLTPSLCMSVTPFCRSASDAKTSGRKDNSQRESSLNDEEESRSVSLESGSEQQTTSQSTVESLSSRKTSALKRRKESAAKVQKTDSSRAEVNHGSAYEEWMWKEFDRIMNNFAQTLHIEYKRVKKEALPSKKAVTKPPQHVILNSLSSLTPLYFKFGAPDDVILRF